MNMIGLFPGQGSQHPGMGQFLFDQFKPIRELFELASDTLSQDLKKLCFNGSEEELSLTQNTQPALVLVSTASWLALKEVSSFTWSSLAGHSVGEYSALVASGTMSFADAVKGVRLRGQLMQSAVPVGQGGMAAVINWSDEDTKKFCKWVSEQTGGVLEAANFNSPGQVVISGDQKSLDFAKNNVAKFQEAFQPAGKVRLLPLKVSAPFHSSMMKPAEDGMKKYLDPLPFKNASPGVVQNFTAQTVTDASSLKSNLIRQITGPVRWVESLQVMQKTGTMTAVEIGCGKVLSGLAKKTIPEMTVYGMNSVEDLKQLETLK